MIIVFFIINTGYNIYQNSQYDKDKQWYLTEGAADVANTWNLKNKTAKKVTVAVIDTGVDYNHEMLKGHMWKNEKEIEGNGIDDDENGFIDDIIGWNFTNNTTTYYQERNIMRMIMEQSVQVSFQLEVNGRNIKALIIEKM